MSEVPGRVEDPSACVAAVVRFAETLRLAGPAPAPRSVTGPANPPPTRWPAAATGGDRTPAAVTAALSGTWPRARDDDSLAPLLLAADRARTRYPGPVGEVLHREIHAYLEVGHRFGGDALMTRLVRDLLAPAPGVEPLGRGWLALAGGVDPRQLVDR